MYNSDQNLMTCTECHTSDRMIPKNGEYVCGRCGVVNKRAVVQHISFFDTQRMVLQDDNLNLTPSTKVQDIKGRYGKAVARSHQYLATSTRDRKLLEIKFLLEELSDQLGFKTNVVNACVSLCKKILHSNARTQNARTLSAVSIIIICRKYNNPKTFSEVLKFSGLRKKSTLTRLVRTYTTQLNVDMTNVDAYGLITRFCSELGMSHKCGVEANKLLRVIDENRVVPGNNYLSKISGILYFLYKDRVSLKLISGVVGVKVPTILKSRNDIRNFFHTT